MSAGLGSFLDLLEENLFYPFQLLLWATALLTQRPPSSSEPTMVSYIFPTGHIPDSDSLLPPRIRTLVMTLHPPKSPKIISSFLGLLISYLSSPLPRSIFAGSMDMGTQISLKAILLPAVFPLLQAQATPNLLSVSTRLPIFLILLYIPFLP